MLPTVPYCEATFCHPSQKLSLLQLLDSPRISFVDLSYLDNDTLLHEAARRKDLRLIELAVRAGTCLSGRLRMRRLERTIVSSCSYDNVRSIPLVATHTDESPVANHDKTLNHPL